jgi:two-component system sensor histidine kinase EvgS
MRCLVVDDEPVVSRLMQRLLSTLDYETRAVSSGEEALALLEHESFDLIVLDLRMPGLSGVETWQRIRSHGGTVPRAVLLTAAHEGPSLAEANDMSFLAKPFDVHALREKLDEALQDVSDVR